MALRLYLPETEAAPVAPPAPAGADWEHVNGVTRKALTFPDASTLTTTAYTPDAADHLVSGDAHHRTYVSDKLAAQTLSGNVKAQLQALEAHANNNLFITLKITVISEDGTTTRATLLAITRDTTTEVGTSLANRNFPSTALTSYACAKGDRLCIEIGLGGTPTATGGVQGHNGSLRFGCNASSGDLPEDDTQTGTTYRPWIEFSNTFVIIQEASTFNQVVVSALQPYGQGYAPAKAIAQVAITALQPYGQGYAPPVASGQVVVQATTRTASWKGQPGFGQVVVVSHTQYAQGYTPVVAVGQVTVVSHTKYAQGYTPPVASGQIVITALASGEAVSGASGGELDSLVSHWPHNETSSDSDSLEDVHGSSTLPIFNPVGRTTGKIAGARRHVSGGNRIFYNILPHFVPNSSSWCFVGWVKVRSSSPDGVGSIIANRGSNNGQLGFVFTYRDSSFRMWATSDGTVSTLHEVTESSYGAPQTDVWVMYYIYYDADNNEIGLSINNGTISSTAHTGGVYNEWDILAFAGYTDAEGGGGNSWENSNIDHDLVSFYSGRLLHLDGGLANHYNGGDGLAYEDFTSSGGVTVKEATAFAQVAIVSGTKYAQGYAPPVAFAQVAVTALQPYGQGYTPPIGFSQIAIQAAVQTASWKGQPGFGQVVVSALQPYGQGYTPVVAVGQIAIAGTTTTNAVRGQPATGQVVITALQPYGQGYTPVVGFAQVIVQATAKTASWKGQPGFGQVVVSALQPYGQGYTPPVASVEISIAASVQPNAVRGQPAVGQLVIVGSALASKVGNVEAFAKLVVQGQATPNAVRGQPAVGQVVVVSHTQYAQGYTPPVASVEISIVAFAQANGYAPPVAVGQLVVTGTAVGRVVKTSAASAQVVVQGTVVGERLSSAFAYGQIVVQATAKTASWKGQPTFATVVIAGYVSGSKTGNVECYGRVVVGAYATPNALRSRSAFEQLVVVGSANAYAAGLAVVVGTTVVQQSGTLQPVRVKTTSIGPSQLVVRAQVTGARIRSAFASASIAIQSAANAYASPLGSTFAQISIASQSQAVRIHLAQSFVNVYISGQCTVTRVRTAVSYSRVVVAATARSSSGAADVRVSQIVITAIANGVKVRKRLRPLTLLELDTDDIPLYNANTDNLKGDYTDDAAELSTASSSKITGSYAGTRVLGTDED